MTYPDVTAGNPLPTPAPDTKSTPAVEWIWVHTHTHAWCLLLWLWKRQSTQTFLFSYITPILCGHICTERIAQWELKIWRTVYHVLWFIKKIKIKRAIFGICLLSNILCEMVNILITHISQYWINWNSLPSILGE